MLERKTMKWKHSYYYFLGVDKEGIKYWLETYSWDCNWYWGFGYIETFTNNELPHLSSDIDSHQHAKDFYPKWVLGEDAILVDTPFYKNELWLLSEYFRQFYMFKDIADFYKHGHAGITSIPIKNHKDIDKYKNINKFIKEEIIDSIVKIVTGDYKSKKRHFDNRDDFDKFMDKNNNRVLWYKINTQEDIDVEYIIKL